MHSPLIRLGLKKKRQAKARRMQETLEESEAHLKTIRERGRCKRHWLKNQRERAQAQRLKERVEEKKVCLEKAKAKRLQETLEEKEVHVEKANAKRLQETAEEKEVYLKKAKAKRLQETPQEKEVHS